MNVAKLGVGTLMVISLTVCSLAAEPHVLKPAKPRLKETRSEAMARYGKPTGEEIQIIGGRQVTVIHYVKSPYIVSVGWIEKDEDASVIRYAEASRDFSSVVSLSPTFITKMLETNRGHGEWKYFPVYKLTDLGGLIGEQAKYEEENFEQWVNIEDRLEASYNKKDRRLTIMTFEIRDLIKATPTVADEL